MMKTDCQAEKHLKVDGGKLNEKVVTATINSYLSRERPPHGKCGGVQEYNKKKKEG